MATIFFDMDGTIVNLYSVDNWLPMLRAENEKPYLNAEPLVNMNVFARLLNKLQKKGYKIGIISWLAKHSTADYDEKVTIAKQKWLKKHLKSVNWNEINIVRYGYNKSNFLHNEYDILFDDEENNRKEWNGVSYDEKFILDILKSL